MGRGPYGGDTETLRFVEVRQVVAVLETREVPALAAQLAGRPQEGLRDGGIDTSGRLYDETGMLLVSDDDGGPGLGFLMSRSLAAGYYFVRVESSHGAAGAYTLSLDQMP